MGRSSLLGVERAAAEPSGRDTGALGPSDSSDSGSDMAGVEDLDVNDPSAPVDAGLDDDIERSMTPPEALGGSSSDAAGTGERRAAGGDAGLREAADISVDRIFNPADGTEDGEVGVDGDADTDEDEDPDLAFVDEAAGEDALSDEDGVDTEDGLLASGTPPAPGHPNPEPDAPDVPGSDDEDMPLDDESDDDAHKPGRASTASGSVRAR